MVAKIVLLFFLLFVLTTNAMEFPFEVSTDFEGLGFVPAFVKSIMMIIVTELGDKTFFIAAVSLVLFFLFACLFSHTYSF